MPSSVARQETVARGGEGAYVPRSRRSSHRACGELTWWPGDLTPEGHRIRIACPCGEVVDRRATPEESELLSPLTQRWSAESLRLEVTVWSSTNISAQVARSGTLPRFGISDLQRVGKSTCASTSIWPYRRMSRAAGRFLNDIGVVAGLGTTARFP